jgi:hypothetical protein
MSEFKDSFLPGEKVRFLHDTGEGVVTEVHGDGTCTVLVDGFMEERFLVKDLVALSFRTEESEKAKSSTGVENPVAIRVSGCWWGGTPAIEDESSQYIINHTGNRLYVTCYQEEIKGWKRIAGGIWEYKKAIYLGKIKIPYRGPAGSFALQAICDEPGVHALSPPLQILWKPMPNWWEGKTREDVMPGYSMFTRSLVPNGKETSKEGAGEKTKDPLYADKNKIEIDLHIQELDENFPSKDPLEIMEFQLQVFRKRLESAILDGVSDMIFIHGVGNGKLKKCIHKELKEHPVVSKYEEANPQQYGYGATRVYF